MSALQASTLLSERIRSGSDLLLLREGSGASDVVAAAWPDRVVDLPMSDRATAAVAVGAAQAGRAVVVEVADAGRLPALAEVLTEACAMARASEGGLTLVWRAPWRVVPGPGVLDLLAGVEGLVVAVARDGARAAALLGQLLDGRRPAVLLEAVDEARVEGDGPSLRAGAHAVILAPGAVGPALEAAAVLAGEGIEAEVLDPGVVAPLDPTLGDHVVRAGRLVVAVPAGEAAFGRRLLQLGLDRAFLYLEAPPVVVTAEAAQIAAAVRAAVAY